MFIYCTCYRCPVVLRFQRDFPFEATTHFYRTISQEKCISLFVAGTLVDVPTSKLTSLELLNGFRQRFERTKPRPRPLRSTVNYALRTAEDKVRAIG